MRKLSYIIFVISLDCSLALAQGVRFGDGQPTIQAGPVAGKTNVLRSLPSASISWCAKPANAVPCTNKAVTYTDSTLLVACSTSTQLVLAGTTNCIANTDALGNWGVWAPAGNYEYTITDSHGNSSGPYPVTLATGSGGGGIDTSVTGVTYTFKQGDSGRLLLGQNTAPMTWTLPDASTLGSTWQISVQNISLVAPLTVVAPSNTIDGGAGSVGIIIPPQQGITIGRDQTTSPNYWSLRGLGFTGIYTGATAFIGDMTVTGNLFVSGNVVQTGTGAFQYSGKCQSGAVTVPAGSDFSLFCDSAQRWRMQLSAALGGGFGTPQLIALNAVYTNATTTFSNLSDGTNTMSFAVGASRSYSITCELVNQWNNTTAVPKIQFTGPSSPTAVLITDASQVGSTVAGPQTSATAFSTPLVSTSSIVLSSNFTHRITLGLVNGANAGTVTLQMAANGAGTLTVQPGSFCLMNP